MAKARSISKVRKKSGWNEFNTFSKLIYPYLEEQLGYPPRKSEAFDEQTWVRKRGETSGPYDGAFKDDRGVVVLIEAKRQDKPIGQAEIKQAFDYCLGETFPIPPPYVLVSNGITNQWFRRNKAGNGEYSYNTCDEVAWKKAKKESGSGELTEQLSLKELTKILSKLRKTVYKDLVQSYFPEKFSLKKNKLGRRKKGFEEVLKTRKTFVDSTLADADEKKAIQFVLSSIALSITLKFLFIKIAADRRSEVFPKDLSKKIKILASAYPGILVAKPYDVLDFSKECEEIVVRLLRPVSILQGLIFETSDNPIGDIWDGLVESEEQDLQVESLGNVYTPDEIVKAMVNSAEKSLGDWRGKYILEPSCGSGHFVREIYKRLRDTYLNSETAATLTLSQAHIMAMSHLRAIDIDPFAVQTTQLGMFLELYREQDVWRELAPKGKFNFSKVVDRGDFLETGLFSNLKDFTPDLVIGNPPYGIKVSDEIKDQFGLGSDDSYGCFIIRGLDLLKENGCLSFVVSNTFMTTKTHQELRAGIFSRSDIVKLLQLHRAAFKGRDVFCCLIELKKVSEANRNYFYKFCDAWPIHPKTAQYLTVLEEYSSGLKAVLSADQYFEYQTNANLAFHRKNAPHAKELEECFNNLNFIGQRQLVRNQKNSLPIHGGSSSLFPLVIDVACPNVAIEVQATFPLLGNIDCIEIKRAENKSVKTVKLWQIARVFQGLCTSSDEEFLRKTPGVVPNARRKYIKDVDLDLTISNEELIQLTEDQKKNGIQVLDKTKTKHFVPFDKGGEQDIEAGDLRAYWSTVDYWIDWSKQAVDELKRRNALPVGTPRKPRLQNTQFYFMQGIRFSPAGLYAPMFEVSFGGVPGHKGSIILPCREELTAYLLPILCSPVTRYLTKNFLQHTVMTEIDVIKQIPIPVPSLDEYEDLVKISREIIVAKQNNMDFQALVEKSNQLVAKLFMVESDMNEILTWMRRRYPNLGRKRGAEVKLD